MPARGEGARARGRRMLPIGNARAHAAMIIRL